MNSPQSSNSLRRTTRRSRSGFHPRGVACTHPTSFHQCRTLGWPRRNSGALAVSFQRFRRPLPRLTGKSLRSTSNGQRWPRRVRASTGPWRSSSRSARSYRRTSTCASRGRTSSAAPSRTGTRWYTTRSPARRRCPFPRLGTTRRLSWRATHPCPNSQCSASSLGTHSSPLTSWCCGRRNSAISQTRLSASSTNSSRQASRSGSANPDSSCCCRTGTMGRDLSTRQRVWSASCRCPTTTPMCSPRWKKANGGRSRRETGRSSTAPRPPTTFTCSGARPTATSASR
mmetsp:Transcript_38098/g.94516  ORF Transcript_38098/g.94516 Transcript_38098/m.94516 type:complete len:285 (-) Transcript_38098:729-1583(-)